MSKKFIAIAGNVGVGKSTLTEKLAAHFGWTPFYEAVDDNPYLADFYRDEVMVELLPPPTLMVYLKASVPTLLRRIAKRGREFEQGIDPHYLERLNGLYNAWIDNFTLCPVLTINADRLNFVQSADDFAEIAAEISARLEA